MTTYHIFTNKHSGTATALTEVTQAFADAQQTAVFHPLSGLDKVITTLADKKDIVIVAAGGDGTVNAVVNAAIKSPHPVGVLPLGTLNHFAKDIGMPNEPVAAVHALIKGHPQAIDIARVNTLLFVNNSSIGAYPSLVAEREKLSPALSKWPAAFVASLKLLGGLRRRHVIITIDNQPPQKLRSPFIFIGNNDYKLEQQNFGDRHSLETGMLSMYAVNARNVLAAIRELFTSLTQGRHAAKGINYYTAKTITIKFRRPTVQVAHDGEVTQLSSPLTYTILPKSLTIIAP